MKKIRWDPDKSLKIQDDPDRGVSLELIAELIQSNAILDIIVREAYPDQNAFVVSIDSDIWCVPFKEDDESIFLITAWPDRKLKRMYK